jgi:hypothetical protein
MSQNRGIGPSKNNRGIPRFPDLPNGSTKRKTAHAKAIGDIGEYL